MANSDELVKTTKDYYDSKDADNFYYHVWGGEDIHVGLYEPPETPIREASNRTVKKMAEMLNGLDKNARVLDIGAGFGGAARWLARTYGCHVTAQNLSTTQNERDRIMNKEQGLDHLIDVVDGNFEDMPFEDESYDFVWCEDSILHSGKRKKVLEEVYRVLKPGGEFIFTDPMQADDADASKLKPIYDRIHLQDLGSFGFYEKAAQEVGFIKLDIIDHSEMLPRHYASVQENLKSRWDNELKDLVDEAYFTRMVDGLSHWVREGKAGNLTWGILHFKKPEK